MAAFSADTDLQRQIDWQILQHGAISRYQSPAVLAEDAEWLRAHGYRTYEFQCRDWVTMDAVHDDIARTLQFPGWYGRNLDALRDCLTDIVVPDDGGVALILQSYDLFCTGFQQAALAILDIIEDGSRWRLLFGRRLVALVQTDDP
ncbi:MAG: barstar family protein, partial [Chloroflexota bacterium]